MSAPEQLTVTLAEISRISQQLPSLVAAALKASAPPPLPPPPPPAEDVELMSVCRAVGAAVDRLEKDRYTRGEIHARRALELQARALREILDRKSGVRRGR